MDHRLAVEVVEVGEDPCFKFGFGCHADVSEHGARHFREEAFHDVEP